MTSQKLIIRSAVILIALVCIEFAFMIFELFSYVPHIGVGLHLLGGCFSGLFVYGFGMNSLKKTPISIQMIFVLGGTAIAAVVWEGFEWVLNMQGSVYNLLLDLYMGMLGGLLACVWVWIENKFPGARS